MKKSFIHIRLVCLLQYSELVAGGSNGDNRTQAWWRRLVPWRLRTVVVGETIADGMPAVLGEGWGEGEHSNYSTCTRQMA